VGGALAPKPPGIYGPANLQKKITLRPDPALYANNSEVMALDPLSPNVIMTSDMPPKKEADFNCAGFVMPKYDKSLNHLTQLIHEPAGLMVH
jgi:hypothetical protein